VYAEDPAAGHLPQAGRILLYRQPQRPGIRVDSGVVEGSEVSVHYDPMIAKVIAHAESRNGAIDRMRAALLDFQVLGLPTNIAFLLAVLDSKAFRDGGVHTAYLDEEGAGLSEPPPLPAAALAAAVAHINANRVRVPADIPDTRRDPWESLEGWRS
jgi:acetyl/propionyl-CoA carboxylase alpha subunit